MPRPIRPERPAAWRGALAVLGLLMLFGPPAAAQRVIQGGVQQNARVPTASPPSPNDRDYGIRVSQSLIDLHHALSNELQVQRAISEDLWNRGYPLSAQAAPECAQLYKQAHDLVPSIEAAAAARDNQRANDLGNRASVLVGQADRCADAWRPPPLQGAVRNDPTRPPLQGGAQTDDPRNPPGGGGPGPNPPGGYPRTPYTPPLTPQTPRGGPGPLPPWLQARLADGTCHQTIPNSYACDPVKPDCTKGAPGAYDPSQNPRCQPRYQPPPQPPQRPPLQAKTETTCHAYPVPESRFGLGDINKADPPLLIAAKISQGWDDCEKTKLVSSIATLPITFVVGKFRGLRTLAAIYGYTGTITNLAQDIDAARMPGESLGDAAYRVGRLLCDGRDLKAILTAGKGDAGKRFTDKPGSQKPSSSPPPEKSDLPDIPGVRRKGRDLINPKNPNKYANDNLPPAPKDLSGNGISPLENKLFAAFARGRGLIFIVRNSNPFGLRWVGRPGAVPKPMWLKAKTLIPPKPGTRFTPEEQAQEVINAKYYGLASAKGLSEAERLAITSKGFRILGKCNAEVIVTPDGGYIYSDIDIHGVYDLGGRWAGGNSILKALNGTTGERLFQHGAQDEFTQRNDPSGPSFGPQPPVTAYTPTGTVQLNSIAEMKAFYQAHGIDWNAIYPRPIDSYRAATGRP